MIYIERIFIVHILKKHYKKKKKKKKKVKTSGYSMHCHLSGKRLHQTRPKGNRV